MSAREIRRTPTASTARRNEGARLSLVMTGVAALAVAGCGGGTTTIIERTVTAGAQSKPSAKPALLKLPTYETWTSNRGPLRRPLDLMSA
jgi:hypothetical protein